MQSSDGGDELGLWETLKWHSDEKRRLHADSESTKFQCHSEEVWLMYVLSGSRLAGIQVATDIVEILRYGAGASVDEPLRR